MITDFVDGCAVRRRGEGPAIVCLPAFGDNGVSWQLLTEALADRFQVAVVELPGLNRAGELPVEPAVSNVASLIAGATRRTWVESVTIVGHSAGSAVAVRVANLLNGQCKSLVSIEGNLTAADAFLTGQAANYDNPSEFKSVLVARVLQMVAAGQAPASYAESLAAADARSLWVFGRDVARQSVDGSFWHEFVHAPCPTLYLWSRETTPEATRSFLQRIPGSQHELAIGHHWPWVVDAAMAAGLIAGFALRPRQ